MAAVAAPDTAAALHRLFAQKRHDRNVLLVATLTFGGGAFYGATQTYSLNSGLQLLAVSLISVPVALVELVVYDKYSPAKERQALADWQGHRLSPQLKKRLTSYYFQPTHQRPSRRP